MVLFWKELLTSFITILDIVHKPMSLARKIDFSKCTGFVYCKQIGILPCETRKDKRELIALCQIYRNAINRGAIISEGMHMPEYRYGITTPQEKKASEIIVDHALINFARYDIYPIEWVPFAEEIANKKKKEVLYISMKVFRRRK